MNQKGKLYLIPSPLGDNDPVEVIPQSVLGTACSLGIFVVEEERTARRFLSRYGLRGRIAELEFHELGEHTSLQEVEELLKLFDRGDVGMISEAGLPAVADPGAALVALCHRNGIEVVPLVGPSSLMLSLMASGLNGQSFAFQGYLPAKTELRRSAIKGFEKKSHSGNQTQIFIETPYRNDSLFSDMTSLLNPDTRLCVAADLTLPTRTIKTMSVREWRTLKDFRIGKRPCVFLILA